MVVYDKYDFVMAVLLMSVLGLLMLCCAGTAVLAVWLKNPILCMCMLFFAGLFGKYTYKTYDAVKFLYNNVKW